MQSHEIFLTVVIPVANANSNLSNILSILEIGSHYPIQFVIVQDIFAEDICTTLESLPARINNCRIDFRTIRAGNPGETRNIGIHTAQGKWICFWDADDKPDIANFMDMVGEANYGNYDVTIGSFESADLPSGLVVSKNVIGKELDYRQIAESPGIWRMAFLRNSIPDIVFSKLRMGEDQLFILDCDNSNVVVQRIDLNLKI
jgi:glycosyltransferase involved in cell wall biosynthesis